ncbi:hypothetical protein Clacol_002053 [Clathrus columnatus]|uniref:Uncharacterized protein n=1 Tax=Clathrus columnatus TaxID=1419009 RepID=A0AAV4ZZP0_9AGAM|nr:hypothetical protein Clacol_002053 [Clathrus columnatus]
MSLSGLDLDTIDVLSKIPIRSPPLRAFKLELRIGTVEDEHLEDVEVLLRQKRKDDKAMEGGLPFPSLRKIDLGAEIFSETSLTADVIGQVIQFLKLVDFTCAPRYDHTTQIIAFMDSVHRDCPNLQKITILGNDRVVSLPRQAIKALIECPHLTDLQVEYCL